MDIQSLPFMWVTPFPYSCHHLALACGLYLSIRVLACDIIVNLTSLWHTLHDCEINLLGKDKEKGVSRKTINKRKKEILIYASGFLKNIYIYASGHLEKSS